MSDAGTGQGLDDGGQDEIIGVRLPRHRTSLRRRRWALSQQEQQDLREIEREHGLLLEHFWTVVSSVGLASAFVAASIRTGSASVIDRAHRSLVFLLSVLAVIEQELFTLETIEIDVRALRRRHRGPLPIQPPRNRTIAELTDDNADAWMRLNKEQLEQLLVHLRLKDRTFHIGRPGRANRVSGEEILLICLTRICTGKSYNDLVLDCFGGGITRHFEIMGWFIDYIFETFYHKISGDSLSYWSNFTDDFRYILWRKFTDNPCNIDAWLYETDLLNQAVDLYSVQVLLEDFWPWALIDCTDWRTGRPGAGPRGDYQGASRRSGSTLMQAAYYSGYFRAHGLKYQNILLPNGLWGSVWGAAMAHNDNGMLNMSGIGPHLQSLFQPDPRGYIPVLLGDAIYSGHLPIMWSTKTPQDADEFLQRFYRRLRSVRQPIEIQYGNFFNTLQLYQNRANDRIYSSGRKVHRLGIIGFFLHNCYTCLKGSVVNSYMYFESQAPTLAQYLPLDEEIPPYVEGGG